MQGGFALHPVKRKPALKNGGSEKNFFIILEGARFLSDMHIINPVDLRNIEAAELFSAVKKTAASRPVEKAGIGGCRRNWIIRIPGFGSKLTVILQSVYNQYTPYRQRSGSHLTEQLPAHFR